MYLLLAQDMRSNFGSNVALLQELTGLDPWMTSRETMKVALRAVETSQVPALDEWRVQYLLKLLQWREELYFEGNDKENLRITTLINSLVIN